MRPVPLETMRTSCVKVCRSSSAAEQIVDGLTGSSARPERRAQRTGRLQAGHARIVDGGIVRIVVTRARIDLLLDIAVATHRDQRGVAPGRTWLAKNIAELAIVLTQSGRRARCWH